MTDLDIEAIRARAADAAQAEQSTDWEVAYDGNYYVRHQEGWLRLDDFMYEETAEFIAHAINDVPALLAEVVSLRAKLAAIDGLLSELDLNSKITRPGTAWGSILREALATARTEGSTQ